ncbi:AQP8 protein, partial [Syrrhaptes paradoxus]|nr:AQP8 protein [Syrrhaptes paradoxus]
PEAMVMVEGKPKPSQPHWFELYVQPCAAELLGTAYFVFVGCLSVVEDTPGVGRLQPALVHGLVLGLLIATMAGI